MLTNRGYPTPEVSAIFAKNGFDWQTLPTLTSMPSGGSINRSGNATLYDSTGKLTYAPNNILTYSQQFDNAAWGKANVSITADTTTAPDGTTTADKIVENTANGTHQIWQNYSTASPGNYLFSFYAKPSGRNRAWVTISNTTTGGANVTFDFSSGTIATAAANGGDFTNAVATITSAGNGWYRCSISATKGISNSNVWPYIFLDNGSGVTYTGDGTSGLFVWGAQLEIVTYQTTPSTYVATTTAAYYGPRFDYNPSTLAAKGLLIEGTRTNLINYSEQLDNAFWAKTGSTITINNTISPDGTNSADKIVEDTSTGIHTAHNVCASTSNNIHSASFFAKAAERTFISVQFDNGSTAGAIGVVNLTTGAVTSIAGTGNPVFNVVSVGNGWWRITVVCIPATSGTTVRLLIYLNNGSVASYTGNGTSGAYIWGAQIEQASFPSSYIPTATSTSRAAETFAITGYSSSLINAYYIDEATGVSSSLPYNAGTAPSPSFSWLTSLRPYTNAYAGSIASPSWLSFSRAGNAMMTDSTGELTYAPNNLLLNTATLSTQSVTTAAIRYVLSFKGTGSVALSGAYTGSLAGTGASNRVALAFTSTAASLTLTVTGTVTEAQLEAVTYETQPSLYVANTSAAYYGPRYDFDSSTVPATPRGLLIEESRTNLVTYSEQFDNAAWSKVNSTISANATTAPDGTVTADKLVENTATANHVMNRSNPITVAANTLHTLTVYAKAAERTSIQLLLVSGTYMAGVSYFFNLSNGTVSAPAITGSTAIYSSSITSVGNGWYRCVVTAIVDTTSTSINWNTSILSGTSTTVYTGDGTSGLFIWGAQLEVGSFPTSYIPTVAASVTRAADVAQLTGSALTAIGGTSVSAIAEIGGTNTPYAQIFTPNGAVTLIGNYGSSTTQIYALKSDATNLIATVGSGNTTSTFRSAASFNASSMSLVANNGTVATAVLGFQGAPITTCRLGSASSGFYINSWYRSLGLYNQKLPDAILKQKSSVGAPY